MKALQPLTTAHALAQSAYEPAYTLLIDLHASYEGQAYLGGLDDIPIVVRSALELENRTVP